MKNKLRTSATIKELRSDIKLLKKRIGSEVQLRAAWQGYAHSLEEDHDKRIDRLEATMLVVCDLITDGSKMKPDKFTQQLFDFMEELTTEAFVNINEAEKRGKKK